MVLEWQILARLMAERMANAMVLFWGATWNISNAGCISHWNRAILTQLLLSRRECDPLMRKLDTFCESEMT